MSIEINKSLILNKLKNHYQFSTDSEFAHFLGIKPQTLSSWHSRNTFDIDLLYAKCVNVDANFLLTGKGEVEKRNVEENKYNESIKQSINFSGETKSAENLTLSANEKTPIYGARVPAVVTVDGSGRDNIVLVPVKAAAGYLRGYGDPTFIQKLPTYNLPGINNGTFRMFQVKGHSMYPTLHDKSYVVGQWIENWVKEIKDNRIYVVVAHSETDEGILVKRVLNRLKKYDNLYLKSDNRNEYPNITLIPQDIIEVWEVKIYLGWELPDPAKLYDKVYDLEAEIEHIKQTLNGKKLK